MIPRTHPAANTVGFNLLNAWPTQTVSGRAIGDNEDGNPNASDTARLVDAADMFTLKLDHRFSDSWTLSGFYLYNKTDEPGSGIMPADFRHIENQAEFFPTLRRRPHVLAINNTNVLNDTTVLTLRFGWQTWKDQTDAAEYSPGLASLGFNSAYVNAINEAGRTNFPELLFDDIDDVGAWGGDRTALDRSIRLQRTLTKLMGTHSLKFGGDFRQLGIKAATETSPNTGFLPSAAASRSTDCSPAAPGWVETSLPACCSVSRWMDRCPTTLAKASGSPATTEAMSRTIGG